MAAGRAIVATDVGANARLVRHEIDGLIVPPGDDRALASAIGKLIESPELAKRFAVAARMRAEQEFGRTAMVLRFEKLYKTLTRGVESPVHLRDRFAA